MNPVSSSRRLLAYGLLLLVPTLLAGLGAVQLLRREQARLAERETYAGEARRAAVTARAGLITEGVELLVTDVQSALLDTLGGLPAAGLARELALWQEENPLVRSAFTLSPAGEVRQLSPAGEAGQAVRRRLAALVAAGLPWEPATATAAQPPAAAREESVVRGLASANVAKLQAARQDARNLAQSREYRRAEQEASARVAAPAAAEAAGRGVADEFALPGPADSRGWTEVSHEGRRSLIGWVARPAAGEVRGLELEPAELIARLAGVLPAETGAGEGYALRDERGRIVYQAGWVPRADAPALQVPLAGPVFAGWEVVAFLEAPAARGSGAGFYAAGLLLVGLFTATILGGGALLLLQARRSEREAAQKTSFVANVSHEFKTPLTTIRLYAELLAQGRVPDPRRRDDYLGTIGRETERLARLVGNVLDFSRLEQGRKKYAREEFDLGGFLAGLLDTHEPRLQEAGLALRRELPAETAPVVADRDAVGQIVLNLLDNAAKYAATGGEVTVTLAGRPGGGREIRVADRGPGVPAAHHTRIFEKFHRVDDSLTAEKSGTGLGLSIAGQLARGLGGSLRCADNPGGGAVFILHLP